MMRRSKKNKKTSIKQQFKNQSKIRVTQKNQLQLYFPISANRIQSNKPISYSTSSIYWVLKRISRRFLIIINCTMIIEHITIKNIQYAVLEMLEDYPFGALQEAVAQPILVRKRLIFHSEQELQILSKMGLILDSFQNENLLRYMHLEQTGKGVCYFYYQYVPLKIEKWLSDLGDDVMDQLRFQLMTLASYLSQTGIKFIFDPNCVGLSKDIKIKYFLKEFAIDQEHKLQHFKDNQARIVSFFAHIQHLEHSQEQNQLEKLQGKKDSIQHKELSASVGTRESWDIKSCRSADSTGGSKQTLISRAQNTKLKTMQLLARLKNMKGKG